MNLPPVITILFFLNVIGSSAASEVTYTSINPFDGQETSVTALLLKGEILPGDYRRLLKFISHDVARFTNSNGIILSSPGGDVSESLRIASFVKGTFTPVSVGKYTGPCLSACFFIYSAAPLRLAETGTIGIHRPYVNPDRLSKLTAREAEEHQRAALRRARKFLEEQDIATSIIDKMFQQASSEIYWLTRVDLEDTIGKRPPWYDQFLITRCGLDKTFERRLFSQTTSDKVGAQKWSEIMKCGDAQSRREASSFLKMQMTSEKISAGK